MRVCFDGDCRTTTSVPVAIVVVLAPVVGMAATPDGNGYWLVASDGGVFTFGDAGFYGSAQGTPTTTVVGMVTTSDGRGYRVIGADRAVFVFGDADF